MKKKQYLDHSLKTSELLNRQKQLSKLNRWNVFRQNKKEAINFYILLKRKQLLIRWFIINIKLAPIFKQFQNKILTIINKRILLRRTIMVVFKCKMIWKIEVKRYGRTSHQRNRNLVRDALTL